MWLDSLVQATVSLGRAGFALQLLKLMLECLIKLKPQSRLEENRPLCGLDSYPAH